MQFNTTTIPTEYPDSCILTDFSTLFVKFVISLFSGTFLGVTAVSFFLNSTKKNEAAEDEEAEDEETEDEDAAADEAEEYSTKYYEEFSRLPERELTAEDLVLLQTKIMREMTPGGEVIMTYDTETETFCYYTNQLKEISYKVLDAVAQKFVITYNCKSLCIDTQAEQTRVEERRQERITAQEEVKKVVTPPKSVFAKFKNYNKNSSTAEFNPNVLIKEHSNHFRYRGKLYEYEETEMKKEKEKEKQEIKIDYAAFKQMMLTTSIE
jgi:hypothetical protein